MPITRRDFLKSAIATGAALAVPWQIAAGGTPRVSALTAQAAPLAPTALTKFTEQLVVPPVVDATSSGAFNLAMAPSAHKFHTALPATPSWGYGGLSYLGPTIAAKRGVPIRMTAKNNLGAHPLAGNLDYFIHGTVPADATGPRTSLHLHGGNTDPASDGHPELTFLPGKSYRYNYANDQEAGTLWYHDHALGITRLNVFAGLAGMYFLRDNFDTGLPGNPLGLPTGAYEIPLVIQDKMFNTDGSYNFPLGEGTFNDQPVVWAPEFFGDVSVVNGKAWPNLNVAQGVYRFRLVNGSNARVYKLTLDKNVPFWQIGADGGLLNAPVELKEILLAPGERADVLIDFSTVAAGTKIVMTNSAGSPFPATNNTNNPNLGALPEIMQFTVGNAAGFAGPIPTTLRGGANQPLPVTRLAPAQAVKVRNISTVEIMAALQPAFALINNLSWMQAKGDPKRKVPPMMETPKVNTVEQWNIINTTGDAHPIHIHLIQFQIQQRVKYNSAAYTAAVYPMLMAPTTGSHYTMDYMGGPWPVPSADPYIVGTPVGPAAYEQGWKDTVIAYPGEITRLLIPFGGGVAGAPFGGQFTGEYVVHCHILDHEDNEMMLPYKVV